MKPSASFSAILGASIALIVLGNSLPPGNSRAASCQSGDVWAGVRYAMKTGDESVTTICVHESLCNVSVSSTDTMWMKFAIACCSQKDQCNTTIPPLPVESSKFDGLECTTCKTGPNGICNNTGMVEMSDCETIKEPCVRFERLKLGSSSSYNKASDCGRVVTGGISNSEARRNDEPFRQCAKVACNSTRAATTTASKLPTTTSPTGGSPSLQNSFLFTVICLVLLESWPLNF